MTPAEFMKFCLLMETPDVSSPKSGTMPINAAPIANAQKTDNGFLMSSQQMVIAGQRAKATQFQLMLEYTINSDM